MLQKQTTAIVNLSDRLETVIKDFGTEILYLRGEDEKEKASTETNDNMNSQGEEDDEEDEEDEEGFENEDTLELPPIAKKKK